MRNHSILFCLFLLTGIFLIPPVDATDAIIAYRSGTGSCATELTNCPKIRIWNSNGTGSWGSEIELATAGSPVRAAVVKASPVSGKIVLVAQANDGFLDAYVCMSNCSSADAWTTSNDIGRVWVTPPTTHSRRYDIAFERYSGDLLVMYGVHNTSGVADLAYKVLPNTSTSFSGIVEQYIDDTGSSADLNYTWVRTASDPVSTSDEIVLVGFDAVGNDIVAQVWSGSAWGNQQEITAAATATGGFEALAVEYEADGGNATVLGGDSTSGNIAVYQWTGSAWVNTADFDIDSDNLDASWITLKADPATDDLQAMVIDNGADLHTAYWNGGSWTVKSNHDIAVDSSTTRVADFEWDPSGSTGRLIWETDTTGDTLNYTLCNPQCNTPQPLLSTYVDTGGWIGLYRNPTDDDLVNMLGGRLNFTSGSRNYTGSFQWNGTGFSNYGDGAMTENATAAATESFTIAFIDQLPYSNTVQINVSSPVDTLVAINHSANWTDDENLGFFFFEWNASGANCDTLANASSGPLLGRYNISFAVQTIAQTCAGNTVSYRFWVNDSAGQFNVSASGTYDVNALTVLTNFTVVLMDGSLTLSVPAAGQNRTASGVEFNGSTVDTKDINGTIIGNSSANQTLTVSMLVVNNTGSAAISIILMLNTSAPSGVMVFADLDNNPEGASAVNATQENVINASVPVGVREEIWVWTNYTSFSGSGSVVDLNISSREA